MQTLSIEKLNKSVDLNLNIDGEVVGRVILVNPNYVFKNIHFTPKGKDHFREPLVQLEKFEGGGVELDGSTRRCFLEGNEVILTKIEFDILYYLFSRRHDCVTKYDIEYKIWDQRQNSNVLDVHIKNLRKKLGNIIESIRSIGFRLKI